MEVSCSEITVEQAEETFKIIYLFAFHVFLIKSSQHLHGAVIILHI